MSIDRGLYRDSFKALYAPVTQGSETTISENYIITNWMLFIDLNYLESSIVRLLQSDLKYIYEQNSYGKYLVAVEYNGKTYYPPHTISDYIFREYDVSMLCTLIDEPERIPGESIYIYMPNGNERIEALRALRTQNSNTTITDNYIFAGLELFVDLDYLEEKIVSYLQ